ncbi:archaellin/type IV pilin N-terminal domain-containing protein [Methanoplanus limicola]|uniref:Flagellin n=1 Tax=Methanoplanus limicola DSM 2279 TaxID=937775 RepID=H1Z4D7_9EURY|nr:archaellin/type IV pilin N-terminal domain-containing protein [Methanoplanus limicola]EHQ36685.1 flagellin domain protein [Methanoplanus limicola DSM 2279]
MLKIRNDEAFTGLEAAIVLIAFVVVAAVFSYVVLGAGFFTTQKSQEVVYTSVDQASSSIEILGDVYGEAATPANGIDTIRFTVGLTAGGSSVDFAQTTITFSDEEAVIRLDGPDTTIANAHYAAGQWNVVSAANQATVSATKYLLEGNEQFTIKVGVPTGYLIGANEEFSLNMRPAVGTAYTISRTAPANIKSVNVLY